jgi:phosphoglycolate phosphatase-like HAD superfamily hydrolase
VRTFDANYVGAGWAGATIRRSSMANELPRPDGLIFDLDGTLVDTVGARIDGWLEALSAAGLQAAHDQVAPMIGMDGKRLAREIAAAAGRQLSDDDVEAIDRAAGEAFDRLNRSPRPLPGVHDVLRAAAAAGIRWVIATSSRKEQVSASVAALELGSTAGIAAGSGTAAGRGVAAGVGTEARPEIVDGSHVRHAKPAPDLLLLAAERLGIPPDRCWAVGDSTWDMRAAVAAGIPGVGVTAGAAVSAEALREAGASTVVETLGDLALQLGGPPGT